MDDEEIILELKQELVSLDERMREIQNAADDAGRELTQEEIKEINDSSARFETVFNDIERRERLQAQHDRLQESTGRQSKPSTLSDALEPDDGEKAQQSQNRDNDNGDGRLQNFNPITDNTPRLNSQQRRQQPAAPFARPRSAEWGRAGYANFGEFCLDVHQGCSKAPRYTNRLKNIMNAAPTTYGGEGVGEDGGFLVPPDFRQQIMEKVMGVDSLLSACDVMPTTRNAMTFPVDNNAPWSSSGPQAYWVAQGGKITESKPNLKDFTVKLDKLAALVNVTDELQEDATALGSYLLSRVNKAFDWELQDALINGSGAGQFQGILNADALITQAKDTAQEGSPSVQPAATVTYKNIVQMWNRLYAPLRGRARWLIQQDVEEQLDLMKFLPNVNASGTPVPVYLPPGGASADPYGRLKGRTVNPVEACAALGTIGDIILADLSQYLILVKTGASGMRQDVSMHLHFDYDVQSFRFIFRVGGAPWWPGSITPPNSSKTRSCFVTLATRA